MLLLTGATGLVGSALLARLLAAGVEVRCLVRDPRRLGAQRVRVQIALGDLADPQSFRNALRGVDTVVHLAASIRDQRGGSIEELNAIASWRLVEAAQRAQVRRFVFLSVLEASTHHRARFFRAKALAERAVSASDLNTIVFAPSVVYAPGDRWLRLVARWSVLPVLPIPGSGGQLCEPIWAEDAADCVLAALTGDEPGLRPGAGPRHRRLELAGPQALSHAEIVALALRALRRRRAIVPLPTPLVSRGLRALEGLIGPSVFATWDEAELMQVPMRSRRGTEDARGLGVTPAPMASVLGAC